MKRKVLSFIAVFVSLSAIAFAQDNEIKIPTDLYKISDYGRNLDIYHTERGSSTLTSVWGYVIQTNIYYRNNIKTCYLVFDLYSEENANDKFYSVIFSDKKENNKVANNVRIIYSNSSTTSYTYNEAEKVYYRFVNDKEHKDYVTGKQYTFKNIITYQVENYTLNDGENKGRQDIKNVGSGTGYYITDGYAVEINWKKSCRECQTEYTYLDGKEIDVNDGNTFIQIQPKGESLEIS